MDHVHTDDGRHETHTQTNYLPHTMTLSFLTLENVSLHLSGNHPTRVIDPSDYADEPAFVVGWQAGFEPYLIAVYGHGLNEGDAAEAAEDFMTESRSGYGHRNCDYAARVR